MSAAPANNPLTGNIGVLAALAEYRQQGLAPLPIKFRGKAPTDAVSVGWPEFEATDDALFRGRNIGIILGHRSGNLVDVDLDCPEAIFLAKDLLPPTEAVFGRESKPRSHWLYVTSEPTETAQFQTTQEGMLVELRSNGCQTVFPPSVHMSGENIEWSGDFGQPTRIDGYLLRQSVAKLAAVSLLIRHWPAETGRFNAEGAIIGTLLRAGWSQDDVEEILNLIRSRAGEAPRHPPGKIIPRLASHLQSGKRVPGLKRLSELLGEEVAAKTAEWLYLKKPKPNSGTATYQVIDNTLHFIKRAKDGPVPLSLCNFAARIEEQRMVDDGVSTSIHFQISGTLVNGAPLPRITLPVQNIKGRPWWIEKWGASAVVTPALGETHLLAAMQTVSAPVRERVVYSHLGWRKLSGRRVYLHADGAIGEAGAVEGFEVEATGELMHYKLPAPVDLAAAVKASLELLEVGAAGAALAAATYRAPLGESCEIACSLFVAGATGVFKSAITGVAQAHWGVRWDGKSFPGNWTSTANSLEKQAFAAKDAVMVIDDFAPRGTSHDVERLNQTADRLLRGAGNRSGRGRMNADGTLRETYWPRGMIVATGEDVPKGHSLRARMVIVDVKKGEIDKEKLSNLQAAAADGRLAQAMAGYVAWIARQADDLPKRLSARCIELRTTIKGDHARTADNLASLLIGLEYMLKFAEDAGAITASKSESLWKTHSDALIGAASGQDSEQVSEEPAERFRSLIRDALGAGRAHLCTRSDDEPSGREAACGWQKRTIFGKEGAENAVWEPRGDRIGFMDGDDLLLIPAAAYSCAERLGRDQNRSLGISLKTLGSRLCEAGWLLSQDDGKSTMRLTAGEQRLRCYHLSVAKFLPELAPSKRGEAKSEQAGPPADWERNRPPAGEIEEPEHEM
jgi:hypothetical protein